MGNKLVCGVGIYQSGKHIGIIDRIPTPAYALWRNMLTRCDPNGVVQRRNTSYIGCYVHQDFIDFQDFMDWCSKQIGFAQPSFVLDKDILMQNNKVYGPDTCCFIPVTLNKLLTHNRVNRGEYPVGVSLFKRDNKFQAKLRICSNHIHLGYFETPELAHEVYKVAKINEIHRQAELFKSAIDPRVYDALFNYRID